MSGILLLLTACSGELLLGGGNATGGTITVSSTLRDDNGPVLPVGSVTWEVETTRAGDDWGPAVDVTFADTGRSPADVVLAVDNSGSVTWDTVAIRSAVAGFGRELVELGAANRVGVVRISTEAELLHAPTSDVTALESVFDELFVSNGWTALWDGIRLANETLDLAHAEPATAECGATVLPVVVAIVDGFDNNSADEHASDHYSGDGVDTDLASLLSFRAGDTYTTAHVVELGTASQDAPLRRLANATGGVHLDAINPGELVASLGEVTALLSARTAVCFVPARCDDTTVRMVASWSDDGRARTASATAPIPASCGNLDG